MNYGIDRQRVIQSFTDGNSTKTKRYFTPLYESITENGVTKKLHYLTSASGLFAIFVTQNGGGTMYYTLKDHQGSLAATVHGSTVERLSYDPWGRRRNTTDFSYDNITYTFDRGYTLHEHYDEFDLINMNGRLYDPILGRMLSQSGSFSGTPMFDRGFTGHEHLYAFGLINMNGRMYDPVMSSFLSADRYVQDPSSAMGFNRYAYCMYNPQKFVDPKGWLVETTKNKKKVFILIRNSFSSTPCLIFPPWLTH